MMFSCSELYCTQCGRKGISVIRKGSGSRPAGHLKKMYCIYDRKETNHAEVRGFYTDYNKEDFLLEFENGNFDKDGNRIIPYRQLRKELEEKGLIKNE